MSMPNQHVELFYARMLECGYSETRSMSWSVLAHRLNSKEYRTFTGLLWNAERTRAFINNRDRSAAKQAKSKA